MTEHWFYHLESTPVEGVLPTLLEKSLDRDWTALVKMSSDRLADMDTFLWTYRDDSFLPHGRVDEPMADQHPIRLCADADAADGANVVILIDGCEISDLSGVERCIFMINGRSETAVSAARARWSRLKAEDATLSYWQQGERGRWVKKA